MGTTEQWMAAHEDSTAALEARRAIRLSSVHDPPSETRGSVRHPRMRTPVMVCNVACGGAYKNFGQGEASNSVSGLPVFSLGQTFLRPGNGGIR